MIVRPLNGLMDKGHQGIGDGDPSLAWLTPHQAPIPCLPQLGNMPQAKCMPHFTVVQKSSALISRLPFGSGTTEQKCRIRNICARLLRHLCHMNHVPHWYLNAHQLTFRVAIMKGLHSRKQKRGPGQAIGG